jgi:hypothetical protein
MYLRFVVRQRDPDSERYTGIFHATADLRDRDLLSEWEEEELAEIRRWFDQHLERPDSFSRSKQSIAYRKKRGISWFKDSALDHIAKAQEMAEILVRHGIGVEVLKAERVGYVVYEDEFQIVAEPFADVRC